MVLSSNLGYNPYPGGADKNPNKAHPPSGVPIRSRSFAIPRPRLLPPQPQPSTSISTLDRSGAEVEDPSNAKIQYVIDNLSSLRPEIVDRIFQQVCTETERYEAFPQPISLPTTAIDPRTARLLQIEETEAPKQVVVNNAALKRKAVASQESSDEDDDDDWRNNGNMQITLHISNEAEVLHFLKMRFTQIQQLATKVIAKAWIKAICPKKQANYPYVDSNPRADQVQKRRKPRHEGAPRIPLFWPKIELCRHKEPDHTRKSERTYLLVHLLRLHWTEQDWIRSNQGCEVPQKIKDRNWVGFLKDAFPISKLDEVQGSNPDKAFMRRKYLSQIYRVAEDEQMLRRRVGPANQKRTYTAGAGWIPQGTSSARTESRSDRPDSEEESNSPTADASAMSRSNSHSDDYAATTVSEEQEDDSRSASSSSEVEIIRETKIEHMPFEGFVQMEETSTHQPRHDADIKYDPMDDTTVPLSAVPASCVSDMGYYGSAWDGGMANVQETPNLYEQHQYTDSTSHWYGGAGLGQQQHAPNVAAADQSWDGYRQCHNTGFEGVHQMAMTVPFVQPVVTAANESQNAGYGVSGVQYVANAYGHHGGSEYMTAPHAGMYGRWP